MLTKIVHTIMRNSEDQSHFPHPNLLNTHAMVRMKNKPKNKPLERNIFYFPQTVLNSRDPPTDHVIDFSTNPSAKADTAQNGESPESQTVRAKKYAIMK